MPYIPYEDRPYRPGVGLMIFNARGEVFVGERIDNTGAWQMPQGGIDEGEDVEIAVFRELEEEIGTRNADILAIRDEWLFYDIPLHTSDKLWSAKYRGQKQKWVALEFKGRDEDIILDAHSHPEFGRWKWAALDEVTTLIVPFKRETYEIVIEEFRPFAEEIAARGK